MTQIQNMTASAAGPNKLPCFFSNDFRRRKQHTGIKISLERYCAFYVTRDRTIIERSSIADAVGFLGPAAVFLAARDHR